MRVTLTALRGDWVRFYSAGKLVIGVVQYTAERHGSKYLCTDVGEVEANTVLEIRRQSVVSDEDPSDVISRMRKECQR